MKRLSRRQFIAASSALAVPGWLAGCAPSQVADLVLVGGEVHTVNAADERMQAVAIGSGQILAVGSNQQIERLVGRNTRRIELGGRSVMPGINDSHLHLLGWGLSKPPFSVDVSYPTVKSIADCATAVQRAVATRPYGDWVVGRGWDQPYLSEGRAPTAADLDAVSANHPVALTEFSGHAVWANSKALELAGITAETVPPPGGVIVKDEYGQPTGLLFEGAAWMLRDKIPEASKQQRIAALESAIRSMLERGVTSCTVPGQSPDNLALLNELAAQPSAAKLRVTGLVMAGNSVSTLATALARRASISQLPAG